jgi:hypothetical protein
MAEEEIMKELKMAEEYFLQTNNELSRTGKIAPLFGSKKLSNKEVLGDYEES